LNRQRILNIEVEPRYPRDAISAWREGLRKSEPPLTFWRARYRNPLVEPPPIGEWISAPSICASKGEADAWASTQRAAWANAGKHLDEIRAEAIACERAETAARRSLGPNGMDWLDTRPLTRDAYMSLYRTHLAPRWGEVPIRGITTAQVRAWAARDRTPGARKHANDLFRTIMATAVDDDVIATSSCKRIMLAVSKDEAGALSRHAPRALTPSEVVALADEVPAYMRTLMLLLCTTGMRLGELRELRVKDLDLEAGTLSVRRAVTGDGKALTMDTPKTAAGHRVIRLEPGIVGLLCEHPASRSIRGHEVLLFPSSRDAGAHMPQRTFQVNVGRACEQLGSTHVSPHDFRNTAVSLAGCVPGVSPRDVQEMLGQATPGMALRYMHSDDGNQRRIRAAVSAEVLGSASAAVVRLDERGSA